MRSRWCSGHKKVQRAKTAVWCMHGPYSYHKDKVPCDCQQGTRAESGTSSACIQQPVSSDERGAIPDASSLRESGIQVHGSERQESAAEIAEMLSCLKKAKEEPEPNTTHPQAMVTTGVGLAALPKKLVKKIKANEYIDFTELPPAKGKSRPVPQSLEGQVLVVQAADLLQARKIIPDLATWLQCFALYACSNISSLTTKQGARNDGLSDHYSQGQSKI